MADVDINKFRASVVRDGSKPASPGFVVSEGQDPVNPPGTNNYVPYSGATANVELGEFGVEAGFITLDTTPTNTPTDQGTIFWDADDETVDIVLNGYTMKIGEDLFYPVKNQTGSTIAKGVAVRFNGTLGASGRLLIAPFIADGSVPSSRFMGVTAEEILNGEDGKVLYFGRVRGINTDAFNEGDILYASTTVAGGYQTAIPVAPNNIVQVAAVVTKHVNNGTIFVRPTLGSNLNTDEAVKLTSVADKNLLQYQSGTALWENKTLGQVLGGTSSQFVKGDGSLDSTSYQPLLTNPVTGTGTTNYLPKFTGASTIGNSIVQDNGSTITVGGSVNLTASTSFPTVGFLNRTSDSTLYIVSPTSGFAITDNSLNTIYNGTPTAHNWNISNALKMTLSSSGNLLIGSPPAADNGARLQVSGAATVSGNVGIGSLSSYAKFNISTGDDNQMSIGTTSLGQTAGIFLADGPSTSSVGYKWEFGKNTVNDFFIYSYGTAGFPFKINYSTGAATFSNSVSGNALRLFTSYSSGRALNFGFSDGSVLPNAAFYIGNQTAQGVFIGDEETTNGLYVKSNGNVGIGTTSPSTLDTGGVNLQIKDRSALFQLAAVNSTYLSNNIYYDGSWKRIVSGYGTIIRLTDDANGISFYTTGTGAANSAVTFTSAMNITNSANVLIGTTVDSGAKFRLFGTSVSANIYSDNNTYCLGLGYQGTLHGYLGGISNALQVFSTNGGSAFLNATGGWTPGSDIKRKRNFENYNLGLNAILGLKPKYYHMDFQKDTEEKQVGLVAQEVKEFIPLAYEENGDFIGLNYNAIIVTMVKAIQDQQEIINDLKQKIQ